MKMNYFVIRLLTKARILHFYKIFLLSDIICSVLLIFLWNEEVSNFCCIERKDDIAAHDYTYGMEFVTSEFLKLDCTFNS